MNKKKEIKHNKRIVLHATRAPVRLPGSLQLAKPIATAHCPLIKLTFHLSVKWGVTHCQHAHLHRLRYGCVSKFEWSIDDWLSQSIWRRWRTTCRTVCRPRVCQRLRRSNVVICSISSTHCDFHPTSHGASLPPQVASTSQYSHILHSCKGVVAREAAANWIAPSSHHKF